MTIKDCEGRVESLKRRFGKYFNQDFNVDVFLLGKAGTGEKREALFRLCSEPLFGFLPSTLGETLCGPTGTAVMMYPFNIRYPGEFDFALCHEFGHVFFNRKNAELVQKLKTVQSVTDEGGMAKFGLSLWSEFISQCIANLVLDQEPARIAFEKQEELVRYLYEALPGLDTSSTPSAQNQRELLYEGIVVYQYSLGLYCANYLTDPTIVCLLQYEDQPVLGLEECTQEVAEVINDILDVLVKKLDEDKFWIVDEPWLEDLGWLVDHLWDVRKEEL